MNIPGTVRQRIAVAFLSLSLVGGITIFEKEDFVPVASIPTEGDRPTFGFGSTFHADGRPVRVGEKITPTRAVILAQTHISKEEKIFRESIPNVALHQEEYDVYMDFVYQFGTGNWRKSSMRRELIAGDYAAACNALLEYRFAAKYDCSTLIDGKPNKRCWGVWTRQLERQQKCMAAQ